jgi:hypothetical protein
MLEDSDLDAAVEAGLIDRALRARLEAFAAERRHGSAFAAAAAATPASKFELVHVLYYAGALLVMGAMGLFANTAFDRLGGWALTAIAIAYAAGFLSLGSYLWSKPGLRTPGGLSVAVAVSMAPLAIYGVQDALNLWGASKPGGYTEFYPLINGSWVYMEIGAIVAAALALRWYPFPFIVLIAAFALWFLSMDLAALIANRHTPNWESDWELRRRISQIVGLVTIAAAWAIDLKWGALGDFGFWLHLFGALTLWGAISLGSGDEFGKALYCAFNVAFIAFGLFLNRRVYVVFGAIGVTMYLAHLAADIFKDAVAFSFALSAIGLAILFAGIGLERRRRAIEALVDSHLPDVLRALRPPRARHA